MENLINFCKTLLYALFVYLGIKTGVVKILFLLMVIDSVLGVLKALRLGEKFDFKILLWGGITKVSILIIPMLLALMAKALEFEFTYFVIAVMNVIIVSEAISCITNILSIKSGEAIENTDYITMVLLSIKKGLTRIIQKLLVIVEEGRINNKAK